MFSTWYWPAIIMVSGHNWEGVPHIFAPLIGSEVLEGVPRKFGLPLPSTELIITVLSYPAAAGMFSVRFCAYKLAHVQRTIKTGPELALDSPKFI